MESRRGHQISKHGVTGGSESLGMGVTKCPELLNFSTSTIFTVGLYFSLYFYFIIIIIALS